ncbi:LysR family transcriptional regulator [uncultured Erythrobacter sp.]|uniref:LysR family transcriptional regulator n=1 Tax=uncultured Erythrobacter sp. TaxID=263913 RepID=UPI002632F1FA|nr:LysR family transcriptional regulator [uncultured Erythrobacter sp.]
MDLEGLRLFVRAAEKLNISAAGRDLGLAPAVASARLAKLEREVGAELLHRSTRKVSVSIEGEEFLPFAREMLAQRDAAMAALGQGRPQASGTIRLAASSSFAQLYIAPILPEFLERYPEINLDLRLSDAQFDLLEGSFDLALRSGVLDDSSLKARKLADASDVLCAAPEYLAKAGMPQNPEEMADYNLIAFRQLENAVELERDGYRETITMQADGTRIVLDDGASQRLATKAGLGISLNARWNVERELRDGVLVQVLPEWKVVSDRALWLVYPKSNVLTAKVRVLIDFLVEKIGRNPPWQSSC